jgi:pyruvate kinase
MSNARQTQIVATIGPSSESEEQLKEMINAGLNIARFNTKHNLPDWHREHIARVNKVAQEMNAPVKVLLDLQGPEVRITVPQTTFALQKDETAQFVSNEQTTAEKTIVVPSHVIESLQVGNQILLEDGKCDLTVVEKQGEMLVAKANYACQISTRKTMNTPGVVLNMPALIDRDTEFIVATQHEKVDYVALSFVRDKNDIDLLRNELAKYNLHPQIIAKIENQKAIDNIDEIIAEADAIMVARGDLGVEVPYYEVPHWQKVVIKKSRAANKFVITATQMLLSMVNNPRPTRAEVNDVANAVYDGTNAVMLSEETAMGKYPVKTVETQAKIVEYHEQFV